MSEDTKQLTVLSWAGSNFKALQFTECLLGPYRLCNMGLTMPMSEEEQQKISHIHSNEISNSAELSPPRLLSPLVPQDPPVQSVSWGVLGLKWCLLFSVLGRDCRNSCCISIIHHHIWDHLAYVTFYPSTSSVCWTALTHLETIRKYWAFQWIYGGNQIFHILQLLWRNMLG